MNQREIKYRIWNGFNMVNPKNTTQLALDPSIKIDGVFIPFMPDWPVMQYTGLKDKNNKEIYEGDIVFSTDSTGGMCTKNYGYGVKRCTGEKFIVSYLACGLVLRHISSYNKSMFEIPNCVIDDWAIVESYEIWNHQRGLEVIGNIHQNTELLK